MFRLVFTTEWPCHLTPDLPWFIGEYGANGQTEAVIVSDLQSMDEKARSDKPLGLNERLEMCRGTSWALPSFNSRPHTAP